MTVENIVKRQIGGPALVYLQLNTQQICDTNVVPKVTQAATVSTEARVQPCVFRLYALQN